MTYTEPVFSVLLIDDDELEHMFVTRMLKKFMKSNFHVEHVEKCSKAMTALFDKKYDLVLLDNLLHGQVSARFSVPIIRQANRETPIVIISNNIEFDYLKNPADLGVDAIVDKADLGAFLENILSKYNANIEARRQA